MKTEAWRARYSCGHTLLTDDFRTLQNGRGATCPKPDCRGEYEGHDYLVQTNRVVLDAFVYPKDVGDLKAGRAVTVYSDFEAKAGMVPVSLMIHDR